MSTSPSTAGASARSTRPGASPGRSPTRCLRGFTIPRASRSGPRSRSGGRRYNVYFSNDRVFIYAIGYPSLTLFDHLVHLAELTTLSGLVLRARAARDRDVHARGARASAPWPGAAARDPRELLPQAVPRVRARVDHPRADARGGDPRLLRQPAARPTSRSRRRAPRRSPSGSSSSRTRCCSAPMPLRRQATTC